jgi:hypothetical protein
MLSPRRARNFALFKPPWGSYRLPIPTIPNIRGIRAIALLPSFLCLDAPLVALGWAWLLAREGGGGRPWSLAALFLAVWVVYLGDRLLDASRRAGEPGLPPRQVWAQRRRGRLGMLLGLALVALLAGPLPRLGAGTLVAGLSLGAVTGLYFLVFRLSRRRARKRTASRLPLPAKEAAIGATFALGVAAGAGGGGWERLPWATVAALGMLFTGNCLLVARCEEASDALGDDASYFSKVGRRRWLPDWFLAAALVAGLALAWLQPAASSLALVASAAASLVVARWPGTTQALADAALLAPWLALAFG